MLKSLQKGLSKFFTNDKIMLLLVLAILAFAIYSYGMQKDLIRDNMESPGGEPTDEEKMKDAAEGDAPPVEEVPAAMEKMTDLLPKPSAPEGFATIDAQNIQAPDLLEAGHHIGLDTIGQSLRNANQQLRSDPVISKVDVGPWHNSTIEADITRVPLELGAK
jgi:hypothetical protein